MPDSEGIKEIANKVAVQAAVAVMMAYIGNIHFPSQDYYTMITMVFTH